MSFCSEIKNIFPSFANALFYTYQTNIKNVADPTFDNAFLSTYVVITLRWFYKMFKISGFIKCYKIFINYIL